MTSRRKQKRAKQKWLKEQESWIQEEVDEKAWADAQNAIIQSDIDDLDDWSEDGYADFHEDEDYYYQQHYDDWDYNDWWDEYEDPYPQLIGSPGQHCMDQNGEYWLVLSSGEYANIKTGEIRGYVVGLEVVWEGNKTLSIAKQTA